MLGRFSKPSTVASKYRNATFQRGRSRDQHRIATVAGGVQLVFHMVAEPVDQRVGMVRAPVVLPVGRRIPDRTFAIGPGPPRRHVPTPSASTSIALMCAMADAPHRYQGQTPHPVTIQGLRPRATVPACAAAAWCRTSRGFSTVLRDVRRCLPLLVGGVGVDNASVDVHGGGRKCRW